MNAPSLALIGWLGVFKSQKTMKQKEITIGGVQYPVEVNFQAVLNFEEIAEKSFFDTDFKKLKDRIALIAAAVFAANEKTKITVDDITGNKDLKAIQEIAEAFVVVMNLTTEFFELPKVVQDAENREAEVAGKVAEGEKPKN